MVIPPKVPQSSPNGMLRLPHLKPPYTFKIQDLKFNWAMNDNQPQMLISLFHQEFPTVPEMEGFLNLKYKAVLGAGDSLT